MRVGVEVQAVPAAPAPLAVHVRGHRNTAHKPARFSVGAGHAFLRPVSAVLPFAALLVQGKDNAYALLPAASCRISGFHLSVGRPGKGRARKERDKDCEENKQAGKSLHLVFRRMAMRRLPGVWFGKAFSMPQRMGRPKPYHSPKCLATLQNTWGRKLAGKACAKRPKMPENCVTRLFAMAGSWCYSLTSGRRRGLPCAADSCDWRDVWHAVQPARRKGPSGGRGT